MRLRLFALVVFASVSQAQLVVLSPTLPAVAQELRTSVAVAGQARSVTAVVAICLVALLAVDARRGPLPVRTLAVGGALASAAGAGSVAMAPTVALFLAAHVLVGAGAALMLSAAFSGIATVPRGLRRLATGRVAAGNAVAWILVAPSVGWLTEHLSWRAGQLVPGGLAVLALVAARRAGSSGSPGLGLAVSLRGHPTVRLWLLGESLSYAAWASLLCYAGAFFVDRHGLGEFDAGKVLGTGAMAYVVSALNVGRLGKQVSAERLLLGSTLALAVIAAALTTSQGTVAVAALLFGLAGLLAGVRTPISAVFAIEQSPDAVEAVMTLRTAATQAGYLVGAAGGGLILGRAGYEAWGWALALSLLCATTVMRWCARSGRTARTGAGANRPAAHHPPPPDPLPWQQEGNRGCHGNEPAGRVLPDA